MEFTGAQSIGILNRQRPECLVEIGRDFVEPAVAAKVAATGGYIGVGHHRCIKYLRPSNKAPFRALALLREAMPEHIIPAKVSGRPQSGLRWLPQLSKAKLGCGGSVAANLLGFRGSRNGKLSTLVSGGLALCQRGERLIQTHTAATPAEVI